jgi:hypothetical protein
MLTLPGADGFRSAKIFVKPNPIIGIVFAPVLAGFIHIYKPYG